MPKRSLVFAARAASLGCLLALAVPLGARAQVSPFLARVGSFLDSADLALADTAARKLLDPQPASAGAVTTWANAESGNSGTLTMGRTFEKDGYDCRSVRWRDVFKGGDDRTVTLDTCRVSGVWRLM